MLPRRASSEAFRQVFAFDEAKLSRCMLSIWPRRTPPAMRASRVGFRWSEALLEDAARLDGLFHIAKADGAA
ncbi:MAG: hypothetical protein R3D43_01185 [Tepidamorphaceae bacterium]